MDSEKSSLVQSGEENISSIAAKALEIGTKKTFSIDTKPYDQHGRTKLTALQDESV